jgi:hypothetical protein
MIAHLEGNPMLTIIAAYAPTNEAEDSDKTAFYETLEEATESTPAHNILVIAADFNARLGQNSHNADMTTIGPHVYHESANVNGELLANFCMANKMCDAQSFFPHRKGRLWTWTHPGGKHKAQLDHMLIRGKWLNSIKNCRAYHNPNVNSDHRMVSIKLRLSLRASVKQSEKIIRYNWHLLREQRVQEEFNLALKNRFEALEDEMNSDIQGRYDKLLRCIKETAENTVGKEVKEKKQHWVSEATRSKILARDNARLKYESRIEATRKIDKTAQQLRAEWKELSEQCEAAHQNDHVKYLEKQYEELKRAADNREARKQWQLVKRITGKELKPTIKVHNKKTPGTATEQDTLNEWSKYFDNLLNAKTNSSRPVTTPSLTSKAQNRINPPRIHASIQTGPFTFKEMKQAVKALKSNKAPGIDDVMTNELLKNGGDYLLGVLQKLCSDILSGSDPPWQWKMNKIVPVPKKGDLSQMTNYRGISLMSAAAKIFNRLILNRIKPVVDTVLRRNQAGFRSGRSTIDQICALRRIFEGAELKQLPLVAIFVDFKKAFDSINRQLLFEIMLLYGVPSEMVNAARKLYDNSKATVQVNGKTSEPFNVTTGVLQGDTLAPFLFVMVIDYVMSNSEENFGFVYEMGSAREASRHQQKQINDLDFADDIAMLENSIQLANAQLEKLAEEASKVGLEINVEKTEYMAFNIKEEEGDVMIADNKLKKVNDFRYLGSMMESTESDFKRRKGLAYGTWNSMEKIWTAKHVRIELKINIFEASVLSILLYGCESWIITPQLEKKINSFATECYRRMLNIKRTDHITLESIYEQVKRRPLMETVRSRQLGWLGHVMRMESKEEPAKIFALYEPKPSHGKARRGAKKISYRSQISKMLTGSAEKLTTVELIELAKDRSEWRKLKNGQDKPPKP